MPWADFNVRIQLSLVAAFAIPGLALIGVLTGHLARKRIRHSGRRGRTAATLALTGSYLLLFGSPILIIFFYLMTVGFALPVP